MPDITIEMPDGLKLRSASKRRYVLAGYVASETRWTSWKRSDNQGTILANWRDVCRNYPTIPFHVVDTRERTVIR